MLWMDWIDMGVSDMRGICAGCITGW